MTEAYAGQSPQGRRRLPFLLQESESTIRLCRRHWAYFWPVLIVHVLVGVAAPIAVVSLLLGPFGVGGLASQIAVGVAALWTLYWGIRTYFLWFRYQNDIWVITDQRVVDSIKKHWFHHQMASADLVDIEDMSVVREGVLATVFDFGDVRCQTAGEVPNFVLSGIPHPAEVLGIVDAARDAARRDLARPTGA